MKKRIATPGEVEFLRLADAARKKLEKLPKVWQVAVNGGFNDYYPMNPLFSTRERAKKFLTNVAQCDWQDAGHREEFPGLEWDERYEKSSQGHMKNADKDDETYYIATEVAVNELGADDIPTKENFQKIGKRLKKLL